MCIRQQLRQLFGGDWDGPDDRLQGLIRRGDRKVKLELNRRGEQYRCSLFVEGNCLAVSVAESAKIAVERGLAELDHPSSREGSS